MSLGDKNHPLVRTTALEVSTVWKLLCFYLLRFICYVSLYPYKANSVVWYFHGQCPSVSKFFLSALVLRYSHSHTDKWRSNSLTFTYCSIFHCLNRGWFPLDFFLIFFPLRQCKMNILVCVSWCIGEWVSIEYLPSSGISVLEGVHFFNFGKWFCNIN